MPRVLLVDRPQHRQGRLVPLPRLVVVGRPRHAQQFALPGDRKPLVLRFDQRPLRVSRHLRLFFEPVELELELADLLVQPILQLAVVLLVRFRAAVGEE